MEERRTMINKSIWALINTLSHLKKDVIYERIDEKFIIVEEDEYNWWHGRRGYNNEFIELSIDSYDNNSEEVNIIYKCHDINEFKRYNDRLISSYTIKIYKKPNLSIDDEPYLLKYLYYYLQSNSSLTDKMLQKNNSDFKVDLKQLLAEHKLPMLNMEYRYIIDKYCKNFI